MGRLLTPGCSGNPGGRPKGYAQVRELAREYTEEAIAKLVEMMRKGARPRFVAAPICRQWRVGPRPSTLKLHVNRVIMSALGNCGRTATLRVRG